MVLSVLIFFAVTSACLGLFVLLVPNKTDERLDFLVNKEAQPGRDWAARMARVVTPFAGLSTPSREWDTSPLRVKFMNAGIRHAKSPHVFFGLKTLLPAVFGVGAFLTLRGVNDMGSMTLLSLILGAALAGCYLPNLVLHLIARGRKREIFDNFPDAADLLLVCVEAGLGLDAALTRVAEEMLGKCPALAEELQLTNLEMRAGSARDKSLRNLAVRTCVEELISFSTMLTQADKFGTSIGESLRVFSEDLRHKRQMRAEEHAAKVPTKMLFPLVLFIFPSIIMVVLGPAIIQVVRTVGPMLTGGQ